MSNRRQAMYVASAWSFCPGTVMVVNGRRVIVVSRDSPHQISIRPETWRDRLASWWRGAKLRMRRAWFRAWDAITRRSHE